MAVPPTRTRVVQFYEAPCQLVVEDGVTRSLRGQRKTLTLPVNRVNGKGRDVVILPNGNELELP